MNQDFAIAVLISDRQRELGLSNAHAHGISWTQRLINYGVVREEHG